MRVSKTTDSLLSPFDQAQGDGSELNGTMPQSLMLSVSKHDGAAPLILPELRFRQRDDGLQRFGASAPSAQISTSVPKLAASIIRPMIERPSTDWPSLATVICD